MVMGTENRPPNQWLNGRPGEHWPYLLTVVLRDVVVTPFAVRLVVTVLEPAGVLVVTVVELAPLLLLEVLTVRELPDFLAGFAWAACWAATSEQFRFTPHARGTIGSFSPSEGAGGVGSSTGTYTACTASTLCCSVLML